MTFCQVVGWSAADWSRPATNKSISSGRKRKSLMFCWERKSWTSWLLTCCSKKGWAAENSSRKVNRKENCFLSSHFDGLSRIKEHLLEKGIQSRSMTARPCEVYNRPTTGWHLLVSLFLGATAVIHSRFLAVQNKLSAGQCPGPACVRCDQISKRKGLRLVHHLMELQSVL